MLRYTVTTPVGGGGQTVLTANLAAAHAQRDRDVLVIDLDYRATGVSYFLGVFENPEDRSETLAGHLLGEAETQPEELIRTPEDGLDVLSAHTALYHWDRRVERQTREEGAESYRQFSQWFAESGLQQQYDTVLIDASMWDIGASGNAMEATQSLVVPMPSSPRSRPGLVDLKSHILGYEDTMETTFGPVILAPTFVGHTSLDQKYRDKIHSAGYEVPVELRDRPTLYTELWEHNCSVFEYAEEHHTSGVGPIEGTLERLDTLAAFLEENVGREHRVTA
jgi:cellulose biosynthesis protein BcsQ